MDCVAALERCLPSVVIQHLINKLHDDKKRSSSDHLLTPSRQEDLCDTVCLVCDVSRLVNFLDSDGTLVKKHTTGLEEEKEDSCIERLNTCFGQFMRIVSDEGGEVFKFAGDMMIALWPPPSTLLKEEEEEEEGAGDEEGGCTVMERSTRSAARCAFSMLRELVSCNLVAVNEAVPQLKIGIGIGKVSILYLGGVLGRVEYVAVGDALVQAFKALHCAKPGCVATSERLRAVVREQFAMCKEPFLEDKYVILNKLPDCSQEEKWDMQPYITQKDHHHIMSDLELGERLKNYIPEAMLHHHDFQFNLPEDEYWYDEVRPISVLSASLGIGEHHDLSAGSFCDKAMMEVHNAMVAAAQESILYNGSINKIVVDDKRCTLIAVYGLPSAASRANGPIHATLAALLLCEKLCGLKLIGSFGIATGEAFCGLVGSKTRSEHTVYGDAVNRADALMQVSLSKGGGVLCDEDTINACQGILDFIPKGKCETERKNQMTVNMFQPYPSEFSSLSAPDLFRSNIFKSIYNQQMSNFVLCEALTGLKMHFSLIKGEGLCSSIPCTTALRDVSSLEKPNEGMTPGNVPIDVGGGKEIFCACVINGLKSKYVVVSSPMIAGNLDKENWEMEDGVLLTPDMGEMECSGAFLLENHPQQICEVVVDADGDPHGTVGSSTDHIWETSGDLNANTPSTDVVEKREDENSSSQHVHALNLNPNDAACAEGGGHQVTALQMGTMKKKSPPNFVGDGGENKSSLLGKWSLSVTSTSHALSPTTTNIPSPGSEIKSTVPDLANVEKGMFHHMLSQCGLIPIPYVLNSKTLDNLSMASMLHILKNFPSASYQIGVKTSFELSDSASLIEPVAAEPGGSDSSAKCMTELLQVLSDKMSLPSVNNTILHHQFGKPVNEWLCSIAVPVDGNIGKLNTSSPRVLLRCDCAKTTTELIEQACALATSEGFLKISSGNSDKFCLNIQGTRAIFTHFDSMPMDMKLLPSVLKEVCIGHIIDGRSKKSSSSASCAVQPLSHCGVIELVLARTDSTLGIRSCRMHAQLVLLQMKASLALEHKGGVVLLEGAPGVGKTYLLSRFAARTLPYVTTLYFTASSPFSYSEPCSQWGALLGHFLDVFIQNRSAAASSGGSGGLAGENMQERSTTCTAREQALLNELQNCPSLLKHAYLVNDILGTAIPVPKNEKGESMVDIDVEVVRKWRLDILLHLLWRMSQRMKLVLIIDNAQYLAQDSWEMVLQSMSLGPNGGPLPMLIVFAFRPLAMHKGLFPSMPSAASKTLLRNRRAIFLKVDGLPPEEVEHLVIDQLGAAASVTSISAYLLMTVEELCLGNPFIIKELMGHLKMSTPPGLTYLEVENEEGGEEMVGKLKATLSNGWDSSSLTPPNHVTALILEILHHVSSRQLLILKTASVMGKEFSFRLLFEIYPIKEHLCSLGTEVNVIENLGLLVSVTKTSPSCNKHLIGAAPRDGERFKVFRFTYGFMRRVLQSMMPLSQRSQLENQFRLATGFEKATMPENVQALKSYPVEQEPTNVGKLKMLKQKAVKRVMGKNNSSLSSSVGSILHLNRERGIKQRDWESRTCFLTRNCLCVSRIRSGQCMSVQVLYLSGSSVVEKVEEHNAPSWLVASVSTKPMFCVQTLHWNIGGVEHKDEKRKFYFIADSKESSLRWVRLISYVIIQSIELSVNVEVRQSVQYKKEKGMWLTVQEWCKKKFQNEVNKWFRNPAMSSRLSNSDGVLVVLVKRAIGDFLLGDIVGTPAPFCELLLDNVLKRTDWQICSCKHNSLGKRVLSDDGLPVSQITKEDVNCTYDCATAEWMEEVSFTVNVEQLRTSALYIHVFSKDVCLGNDYLGSYILPLSDLLQESCTDMVPMCLELASGSGKLEIGCHLKVPAEILENVKSGKIFSTISSIAQVKQFGGKLDYSIHDEPGSSKQASDLPEKGSKLVVVDNENPNPKSKPVSVKSMETISDETLRASISDSVLSSKITNETVSGRSSHRSSELESLQLVNCGINVKWMIKNTHPLKDRIFVMDDPWVAAQDRYLLKGWEFDILSLELEEVTLFIATLFAQSSLPEIFSISPAVFVNFLYAVQQMMSRQSLARYHNYTHIADVTHASWTILYHRGADPVEQWKCPWTPTGLSPVGDLSILIASLCHDLDHPGLSNDYHINTGSDLGRFYGDKSPLENHHIAVTWSIIRRPECNIFLNFTPEELIKAKHCMHSAILRTDMTYHGTNQQSIVNLMGSISHPLDAPPASLSTDMLCTCGSIILHGADISTAGRPWKVCFHWVELLYLEFNEQAKKEKEASLAVSVMQGSVSVHQPEFIDFIVPYFEELDKMIPNVLGSWLTAAKRNKKLWIEVRNEKEKESSTAAV